MNILEELKDLNLNNKESRKTIVKKIMADIKGNGWYLDLGSHGKDKDKIQMIDGIDNDVCHHGNALSSTCLECDEEQAMDSWVCMICNESTYDVEYDYMGSGTNHLSCELEIEMKEMDSLDTAGQPIEKINDYLIHDIDKVKMIDGEKQYSIVENLGWDARNKRQKVVGEITESEYEWLIGSK